MGIPFKGRTISRIIRSQQMILDRLREARSSLGMQSFSQRIKDDFTHKLYPYRRQARRFTKAVFYLCACSLATKKPLPSELPSALLTARGCACSSHPSREPVLHTDTSPPGQCNTTPWY